MVLALTPLFLDARFREQVTPPVLDLVTRLARKAVSVAGQPDAGIWEYRSEWSPQTFSSLMCWAAADRMARISKQHRPADAEEFAAAAHRIREELLSRAVDPARGCFVADYGGTEVDAALLQAVTLRLLPSDDQRLHATVNAVQHDLRMTAGSSATGRTMASESQPSPSCSAPSGRSKPSPGSAAPRRREP
jgi:GH15 family glucan-1,4-alpha-glucosidase